MEDLEERLKHERAFEGLMSLIPAKHYYAEDQTNSRKRKKQTKEEKRATQFAKLNPANHKSAADVMADNERKRKRQLAGDESEESVEINAPGREKPGEGLKKPQTKKQKQIIDVTKDTATGDGKRLNTSRTPEQIEARRKQKADLKKEKLKLKNDKRQAELNTYEEEPAVGEKRSDRVAQQDQPLPHVKKALRSFTVDLEPDDIHGLDLSGLDEGDETQSSAKSDLDEGRSSPVSDPPSPSSSSSIVPPVSAKNLKRSESSEKELEIKLPTVNQDALKARLAAKIEALRAARKADGIDGKPAKNRQELMEARRRKEEERKQRKKELRKLAKEEEEKLKAEAELARLRGSGSPLTPDVFSPAKSPEQYSFSFGKVTFGDGQQLDPNGSELQGFKRRKGPSDPKTALEAAKRKEGRIHGLDEAKRTDIERKDAWLNAKKRAHGERVRDDTSLLKKTLKRKEKLKSRSEKEWNKRIEGVKQGQEARQKKREENLRKRKEEKGSKKGKRAKVTKKKARPGFEGKFGK